MKVHISYFTETGSFYAEGSYSSDRPPAQISDELYALLANQERPGLVSGPMTHYALVQPEGLEPFLVTPALVQGWRWGQDYERRTSG